MADEVLRQGIQGISDLITERGLINLDFADVKSIMTQAGSALMAIGRGSGDSRMVDAANMAISSPLLELSIDGAKGVLFNVTGGEDLGIQEVYEAADIIQRAADPDAQIIFGARIDPTIRDEVKITLIATGFDNVPRAPQRTRSFPGQMQTPTQQPQQQPQYQPRPQVPTPIQQQPQQPRQQPSYSNPTDDLDIPPFLRNRRK